MFKLLSENQNVHNICLHIHSHHVPFVGVEKFAISNQILRPFHRLRDCEDVLQIFYCRSKLLSNNDLCIISNLRI